MKTKKMKTERSQQQFKSVKSFAPLKERRRVKMNFIATLVWLAALVAASWAGRQLGSDPNSWLSRLMMHLIEASKSFSGESRTQWNWGPLRFETGWTKKQNGPTRPWVRINFNFQFPDRPVREKGKKYKK